MYNRRPERQGTAWMFGLLFLLLMVRNCACGPAYFPQLDDYIAYCRYIRFPSFAALQEHVGLLASRPLAGLADYYLWGRFFDHMILGLALVALLYAGTALLLWRLLQRYFRLSPLFPVIVALLPLGMEGTYWMSAATRVVGGMFFAVLAAWAFLRWLEVGGPGWLGLYLALQLLPFGFYEQPGIFSITLTVGVAILEWSLNRKAFLSCAVSLWGVLAMGLNLLFSRMMAVGTIFSGRMDLVLPTDPSYWTVFFPRILDQFREVFIKGGFFTLVKGFARGARLILSGQLLLWVLVLAAVCAAFFLAARRPAEEAGPDRTALALLSGLLLAAGPVSIFLVLRESWFSMRGAVTSFPGLALLADTAVIWLWDRLPFRRGGLAFVAAAAAFVFCVAGASEVTDYRDNYENDQYIARLTLDTLAADGLGQDAGRVGVLNLLESYLPDQNFFYHDHILGCTASDWAFTGMLAATGGEGVVPTVTPLHPSPVYKDWNRATNYPADFPVLYWFDGASLIRVELEETGENTYQVLDPSGRVLALLWEKDRIGYLTETEN